MLRLFFIVALAGIHGTAQLGAQDRPMQADGIVRLLLDLESAIAAGQIDAFRAIATPTVTPQAISRFEAAARGGAGTRAIVRERSRRATGSSIEVLADVLVSQQATGRVSTWQIVAAPGPEPGQFRINDLKELAAVDGLLKLQLDTTRQFAVKDLVINAPDLTYRMASGSAFVAESPNGTTVLVLRGKGEIQFTPSDRAEQQQLRIFAGRSAFTSSVDSIFLRLNPAEFVLRVSKQSLTPTKLNPAEANRAQQVFDELIGRTFNIDLRSLTPERWSLEPTYGNLVLEFRTSRFGWLTYVRSPNDHEDISLFDRERNRYVSQYTSQDKRARSGRTYSDDDGAVFDIVHQRLDLAFDPARLWVSGRATVQLRITAATASTLTIRLAQPLAVASVSSPALGELLFLRIIGQNTMIVGLPAMVERNASITLDVVYGGRLGSQDLDREAIAPQGQQRPGEEQAPLILVPEPRFLYSNRVPWYPQGNSTDYSTAELRLSVPSEYQIVASGTPLRASVVPSRDPARSGSKSIRVVEYAADRPVRYLACVISRFVPIGRERIAVPSSKDVLNLDVVSTSRMKNNNRQTPQRVAAILTSFAEIVGDVPYPDFTLAALDENLPGGHSPAYFAIFHQALPTTPYSWSADPVAFDDLYAHFFLAHEIAHQWWGQAVGWKNYHEQWLSEGLAQYFAALYAAEDRGPAMLDTMVEEMRKRSEDYLEQGPIYLGYRLGHIKADGRVFRALVYNKSAVVLHMLRRLIGDDAFFQGLRRYYTKWRFNKAGTDDFVAAMQAGTTLKLERFFEQWIRGSGRPRIHVTWRGEADGRAAVIRIEQVQAGEVFDFPLTVAIQYEDGRSETRTLRITAQAVEERVEVTSPIRRVTPRDPLTLFEMAR